MSAASKSRPRPAFARRRGGHTPARRGGGRRVEALPRNAAFLDLRAHAAAPRSLTQLTSFEAASMKALVPVTIIIAVVGVVATVMDMINKIGDQKGAPFGCSTG